MAILRIKGSNEIVPLDKGFEFTMSFIGEREVEIIVEIFGEMWREVDGKEARAAFEGGEEIAVKTIDRRINTQGPSLMSKGNIPHWVSKSAPSSIWGGTSFYTWYFYRRV